MTILPSSRPSVDDLPIPGASLILPEPFEAPRLIIPIDNADPNKVIGNGYTAQLSPTVSTIFVYDVDAAHLGKTCTLAFHMPPPFEFPNIAPVHIQTPGGISVSRLSNQAHTRISAKDVGISHPVCGVLSIEPGHQYNIASAPCEAGQTVGYQVDSLDGLKMDWFQMTSPPLGLFMLVT